MSNRSVHSSPIKRFCPAPTGSVVVTRSAARRVIPDASRIKPESRKVKLPIPCLTLLVAVTLATSVLPAAYAAANAKKDSSPGFPNQDDTFLALRDAARRFDSAKANQLASRLNNYPIPSYVDYYRLKSRIGRASASEIREFLIRYNGSAIGDRMRNDWLLNLGYRRDWATFDEQYPQFVLNDDTRLKCYALISRSVKGQQVADEARLLLVNPKEYGDGCNTLLATLAGNGQFSKEDLWAQVRLAAESNSSPMARRAAGLLGVPENLVAQAIDTPSATLVRDLRDGYAAHQIFLIALGRSARADPQRAASRLTESAAKLTPEEQAQGWAQIALPASFALAPEAIDYWRRSLKAELSNEGHQWKVRIALRNGDWKMVRSGIEAMPDALRADPAWIYWLARALQAEGKNEDAKKMLQSIFDQTNFYGQLALEEAGQKISIPQAAQALLPGEIAPMASNQGFSRSFKFFSMNLRFEGTREWNWELRKMSEREHLAAAEFARQNNVLDRMVNTSDRTKKEVDFTQRFPSPFRDRMIATTQKLGVDMAWVYGLIRQESRFMENARSSVGASGLMQLMPATARYVAKKIGLDNFKNQEVNDINTNLLLGTHYLNMVLENLDGSQPLATAAYNAGPGRPRAWRANLPRPVEGAIFAESIPFTETRDYVKKVLSNATYYAALFENRPQSLKMRLGIVSPKKFAAPGLP